ncbi:heterokaryon incompatibility protein-domain-containing protein [Thelonectria olida]|uniref:Heterokaryon incompatibility protein-domain-containing protein n=1 Tax=Thelonectria olida TaxID=1576542 RepID=A0A9P8VSU9_9HYPO|nr:heterokaryon incompatibility protein-domain-containing protein [Thelonectria olida]
MTGSDHYCLSSLSKEIRLLAHLRKIASRQLSGQVRRVSIHDTTPFVSISHVWGHEKAEAPFHLESGCGNRDVPISRNLESLLLRLLCHDGASLPQLWSDGSMLPLLIDMVCINQTNVDEKASQIPLMRRIYSQAKSVIIWINESDSSLFYAFQSLRRIVKEKSHISQDKLWTLFDPVGWDALNRLLSCDWFHRRWVIQEAVIPKEAVFLCGSDVITMDDLFSGVDVAYGAMFQFGRIGSLRPIIVLKQLRKTHGDGRHHRRLLWLLENLRTTKATMAHDQVPEEALGNPIRYDLDPEEIFRAAVETHARLYNDLEFLGLCAPAQRDHVGSAQRPFRGPSWRWLGLHDVDRDNFFKASGSMAFEFSFEGSELAVSGILVDKILNLGDFNRQGRQAELSDPNSMLFQEYFDFWMKSASSGESMAYPDSASHAEAFARALSLLGVYKDSIPSPDVVPTMFYHWCKGSTLGRQLEELGLGSRLSDKDGSQRPFIRMKRLLSWQPFITEKGYIGLAREQCWAGDEIWVVAGCSVPIVLSRIDMNQNGKMEVKGECFIDGFMFGEISAGSTRDTHKLEKVTLV